MQTVTYNEFSVQRKAKFLLHRPIDKAVVIGDSDPRRPIYFPDLKPGVELRVPSFGETEMPVITRVLAS